LLVPTFLNLKTEVFVTKTDTKTAIMSLFKILNEDWSDYNDKKAKCGSDPNFFSGNELWEVEYLKDKIKKHHQFLSEMFIKRSIIECGEDLKSPYPRTKFIECVACKLGIPTDRIF